MRNILKRYECISSQAINYSKYVVTFSSNTSRENRELVSQILGVCEKQDLGIISACRCAFGLMRLVPLVSCKIECIRDCKAM